MLDFVAMKFKFESYTLPLFLYHVIWFLIS